MTVRGHRLEPPRPNFQQQPGEVVANVLARHRELGEIDQALQLVLRYGEHRFIRNLLRGRIVARRQGGQRESASSRANMSPVGVIDFEIDPRLGRKRLTDIDDLAGRDRDFAIGRIIDRHPRLQLHLRVRRGERQHAVARSDEYVREDRERVPLLDDPPNREQRGEQHLSVNSEFHGSILSDL